jgi:hypothetical protein
MGATVNYSRFKNTADSMITKWGMRAVLRRSTGDRWCNVVITNFSPMERTGQTRNPLDRKVLVSSIDLDPAPDQERDRLITFVQPMDPNNPVEDEVLKIVEPPGKIAMAGSTVYYRLAVRR